MESETAAVKATEGVEGPGASVVRLGETPPLSWAPPSGPPGTTVVFVSEWVQGAGPFSAPTPGASHCYVVHLDPLDRRFIVQGFRQRFDTEAAAKAAANEVHLAWSTEGKRVPYEDPEPAQVSPERAELLSRIAQAQHETWRVHTIATLEGVRDALKLKAGDRARLKATIDEIRATKWDGLSDQLRGEFIAAARAILASLDNTSGVS